MRHPLGSLWIAVLFVVASATAARPLKAQSIQLQTQRSDDESRRREEVERIPRFERTELPSPASATLNIPRKVTEPCLSQLISDDPVFDLAEIPLEEWVATGSIEQIPWRVQFPDPQLRLDQRYELSYSARIEGKDLGWSPEKQQELIYVSGVRSAGREWVIPPKSIRHVFDALPKGDFRDLRVISNDCVLLQPGEYFVWFAIYDPGNEKRSIVERRIRVPEFKSDPLPQLNGRLPMVEYPKVGGTNRLAIDLIPGPLVLSVSNKRPLSVALVSVLSSSDQWSGRSDIIRWQNNRLLTVTSVLSQLQLTSGDVSVAAVDVVNQNVAFEQNAFGELDWPGLSAQFNRFAADQVIALPALQSLKKRSSFLRELLEQRLAAVGQQTRILILISGSLSFERGSDLSAVKVEGDCNCRIYHLRVRLNGGDAFDHVERLIKPLRPKTFNIESPEDLREALGKIVQDLESL
jgi:hypothetical protein